MTEYKACSVCKQIFPLDNFNIKTNTKTGRASACKPCGQAQKRNISAEQRERKNAKNRLYRANNKEAVAKTNRQQYLAKQQARIDYVKQWMKSNPELVKRYNAISKRRNHVAIAADTRRRNARRKNNGIYKITKKELSRLLAMPCFYCGSKQNQTIDHVVAIARGGTDSIGNLVTACKSCNSRKRHLTIMEWRIKKAKE